MSPARRSIQSRLLAISLALTGPSSVSAQIRPEPAAIELASPEVLDRLRADSLAYFRFVNRPWIARVCEVFADDMRRMPTVRLHGDAHVAQFAVTREAWGLDDFDDSVRGPALVDVVRYLGSVDLLARERGWIADRDALFDRFFAGYRTGRADADFRPPQPAVVGRLRVESERSATEFLTWGEGLMAPMAPETLKVVRAAMAAIARFVHAERPDLPPEYLTVIRAGWLHMGIGSAVVPKVLIRIQGASSSPDDDLLVEAKQARDLGRLSCLEPALSGQPTLRVVQGAVQLGRLKHDVLIAGPDLGLPEFVARGQGLQRWWFRSWDPDYRELDLDQLRSVGDLAEVVYDAGAQLGAGRLKEEIEAHRESGRDAEMASLASLERRARDGTRRLVDELLSGWNEFRGSRP